jgi:outer membrane receptor protein involved in Fe transport
MNLGVEVRPRKGLSLFATVRNLLDKDYATAAQLGATAFDAQGRSSRGLCRAGHRRGKAAAQFHLFAPGAPRAIQVGGRVRF